MVLIHPDFCPLLQRFASDEMKRLDHVIFGLWPDLTFALFNEGWFRFAEQNEGEPRISREWVLGRSLLEAVPEVLLPFFRDGFTRALATGERWEHEYDCSSPETFRLYHQSVYPLGSEGLLVVNSLKVEGPLEGSMQGGNANDYLDPHAIVHQCARCRKVENVRAGNRWDWIPGWIASPPEKVSHGLCPVCLDYYYPLKTP